MNTKLPILACLLSLLGAPAQSAPPSRPNVIVILADDLGWSDLGCYGSEIQTPNLDRLAANGLRFSQFYNSAKCEPTRASLMSGQVLAGMRPGHHDGAGDARGRLRWSCFSAITVAAPMIEVGAARCPIPAPPGNTGWAGRT